MMEGINMVNAPVAVRERGIDVAETVHDRPSEYQTLVRITIESNQQSRSVAGTLFAGKRPRLVEIKGIPVEADFAAALQAKDNCAAHCQQVASKLRSMLEGTRAIYFADLDAGRVADWLDGLRHAPRRPDLPEGRAAFKPGEVARLLGLTRSAVSTAGKRLGLEATGNGKARCFPRATVEALRDRQARRPSRLGRDVGAVAPG